MIIKFDYPSFDESLATKYQVNLVDFDKNLRSLLLDGPFALNIFLICFKKYFAAHHLQGSVHLERSIKIQLSMHLGFVRQHISTCTMYLGVAKEYNFTLFCNARRSFIRVLGCKVLVKS